MDGSLSASASANGMAGHFFDVAGGGLWVVILSQLISTIRGCRD